MLGHQPLGVGETQVLRGGDDVCRHRAVDEDVFEEASLRERGHAATVAGSLTWQVAAGRPRARIGVALASRPAVVIDPDLSGGVSGTCR
jgi:hypothetical protein